MKPFNLEEALAGKPVVTRDGRKVTEIHHLVTASSGNNKLIAVIGGSVYGYNINGEYNSKINSACDLFMDEIVIEKYVNVYYNSITEELWIGVTFPTYQKAIDSKAAEDYLKTIKINNKPE
jgi:hypothetical protein